MKFLKGFFGFYKFLYDTNIPFIETCGRIVACSFFVAFAVYFLDFVGILAVGGK